MIRKRLREYALIALSLLLIILSYPSFVSAQQFSDVNTSHWAYESIEKMANLGFLKGFEDGTFRPDAPDGVLKFIQTMSALANFVKPTDEDMVEASFKYNRLLKDLNILTDWEREAITVAIYKDIISENNLKSIVNNGNLRNPINRADFSEYLVKAMGMEESAQNQKAISLPYKDSLSINPVQHKYLFLLLKAGILSPDGKGGGYFKPKDPLTRAEMAKMLSASYEFISNNDIDTSEHEEPEDEKLEKVKGRISRIVHDINKSILFIYNSLGEEMTYYFDKDTTAYLDGKKVSHALLTSGQDVELGLKSNTRDIIDIVAKSVEEELRGRIKYIDVIFSKLTIEYVLNKSIVSEEFKIEDNVKTFINGKLAEIKDLKSREIGEFKIKNNKIYNIDIISKDYKYEGVIKELTPLKGESKEIEYYIIIVDDDKDEHKFIVNSDTLIYRNNRRVRDIDELKLKDKAYIEIEYDLLRDSYIAVDIDANVVIKTIKGFITGINTKLHQNTEVTIFNQESKEEEQYVLGKDVFIRVDKDVTNSLQLKTGYYVEIITEGDEITEIEADSRGREATILGKIVDINYRSEIITIEVQDLNFDNSRYGERITVYTKGNLVVVDKKFNKVGFDYLYKGDIVNIIGSYDGSTFIADTIQLR